MSPLLSNVVLDELDRELERRGLEFCRYADDCKFLGMTIIEGTVAISRPSIQRAMQKVKELTPRGTHFSLEQTMKRINEWYMG